jgi:hypothetical protein
MFVMFALGSLNNNMSILLQFQVNSQHPPVHHARWMMVCNCVDMKDIFRCILCPIANGNGLSSY